MNGVRGRIEVQNTRIGSIELTLTPTLTLIGGPSETRIGSIEYDGRTHVSGRGRLKIPKTITLTLTPSTLTLTIILTLTMIAKAPATTTTSTRARDRPAREAREAEITVEEAPLSKAFPN